MTLAEQAVKDYMNYAKTYDDLVDIYLSHEIVISTSEELENLFIQRESEFKAPCKIPAGDVQNGESDPCDLF